jgi:mRNA interferase RelE/StbE
VKYGVVLLPAAQRGLKRLPSAVQSAVRRELRRLEAEPRHSGIRPIVSQPGWLRARVGDYRVIFAIDDPHRRVVVKSVARRDKAY